MSCSSRAITTAVMLLSALTGCAASLGQSNQPVAGHDLCSKPQTERTYFEPCITSTSRQPDTPIKDVPGSALREHSKSRMDHGVGARRSKTDDDQRLDDR